MQRVNRILAGLLVLQAALLVWAYRPPADSAGGPAGPLLSDLDTGTLTGITIASGPDRSVELRRTDGEWRLPERGDYPADAAKVASLLEKIGRLDTRNLVARSRASHRRLKVAADEFNRKVELKRDGETVGAFYLGSSPGYRKVHLRRDGDDAVYVTDVLAAWELNADAGSWLERNYVKLAEADVGAVRIENGSGTFRVEKGDNGAWRLVDAPPGKGLDGERWNALLQKALVLRMTEPLGTDEKAEFGLDTPALTLTIERSGRAEPLVIRAGAHDEKKRSYVVKSSDSRFYVRVSDYVLKDLVEAAAEGLLKDESAGTDAGGSDTAGEKSAGG